MPDRALDPSGLWPSSPEEDRRSRDALDRALLGFQIIGFDWRYLYVNPAAARQGRQPSPRSLVGRTMAEVYPGIEDTPMFRELQRCMTERSGAVFDNEFTFPDGSRRWFELRVQPVPEGISVYSIDIHDRRMAAEEMAQRLARYEPPSVWTHLRTALFGRG